MKLTFPREPMLAGFQAVASVVPVRTPKPILKNVRLSADGKTVVLFATDTEIAVRIELADVQTEAAGEVLLPVERFGPILRECADERMTIESDGNEVMVHGARSEFHLPAYHPDEYPLTGTMAFDGHYQVSVHSLTELIHRTIFAVDTETSRFALGGVLLEFEDDRLFAVATDARRLAKMESPARVVGTIDLGQTEQIIVPSRALQLMEKLLSGREGDAQLAVRENDVLLKLPDVQMSARLLEGRFPNWRDVMASSSAGLRIDLCVGPLASAVRQAAIVADKESRSVELLFRDGTLELSCSTAEVGSSRVELPVAYHGEELPVPLDSKFLADFLRVLDLQTTVAFSTAGIDRPAEFRTDDGYVYVIMPMERRRKKEPAAAVAQV